MGVVVAIIGGIFHSCARNSEHRDELKTIGIIRYIIGGILFLVAYIGTGYVCIKQIAAIEKIEMYTKTEKIYAKKADELIGIFAKYLMEAYLSHEKEIFDKISPELIDIYLVKYPELQASKTIMELVAKINHLQSDRYDQMVQKERELACIRIRKKNPWVYRMFIPVYERTKNE